MSERGTYRETPRTIYRARRTIARAGGRVLKGHTFTATEAEGRELCTSGLAERVPPPPTPEQADAAMASNAEQLATAAEREAEQARAEAETGVRRWPLATSEEDYLAHLDTVRRRRAIRRLTREEGLLADLARERIAAGVSAGSR